MNLGNLITQKLIESKYENKKELYEAMKYIVGDNCCAYNTFTEALSKNKNLSDVELLTISNLLDIDLNKLALHYVNFKSSVPSSMSIDEYIKDNKEKLLSYISYIMGDDYKHNNTFCQYTLSTIKDRAYFLHFNEKSDFMICYEFSISMDINGKHILKTNEVARFEYFKSILDSNNLDRIGFISMDLNDKINLLKNEGKIYYELFPNNKKDIEATTLSDFEYAIIKDTFKKYIEDNKDSLIRTEDNKIFLGAEYEISSQELLRGILEDELYRNNINNYGIKYTILELLPIFKEEAAKILPITQK